MNDMADSSSAPTTAPLATRVVRGSMWVTLGSYWNMGFGFVINIVLTRLLTPDVFGTYAYALFFITLFGVQPKLGTGYAYAHSEDNSDQGLSTYVAMDFLAALGGFVITLIALPFLPTSIRQITLVLSAIAILQNMASTFGVLLEKEFRFAQTSLPGIVINVVSYAPAVLLAMKGAGIWALVAQNMVVGVFSFMVGAWLLREQLNRVLRVHLRFDKLFARMLLRFGVVTGLSFFAGGILTQMDNFMVATFVSVTTLGFYDRGYRLAQWPALLFNGLSARVGFYTYAKLQHDKVRLEKMMSYMLWAITTIALPLAVVLFITAPDLITFLYTDRWLPAVPYVRILVLASAVRPLWENAGSYLIAVGKPHLTTRFTVLQVLVLGASGVPLTLAFGAIGTCIAVGLAVLAGIALVYRYLSREIHVQLKSLVGLPLLISAFILVGYVLANRYTPIDMLAVPLRLVIKAAYVSIVFFGTTYILHPLATRERIAYIWRMASGKAL